MRAPRWRSSGWAPGWLKARIDSARMVLSDRTIKAEIEAGRIVVDPFDEAMVQPSSVDVRVDRRFRVFRNARYPFIDVRQPMEELTEPVEISDDEPFILHPGEFVLGQTLERVRLPDDIVARLEGKSSLGRLGLLIHSTAGFVDPGFEGNLTLELSNVANLPVTIYYAMPIGQISFVRVDQPVERPYGAERGGQQVPGPGRAHAEPLLPELQALAGCHAGRQRPSVPCVVMPGNIGLPEVLVVLVIALIIFGPKRLPELGARVGKGIREFRVLDLGRTTTTRSRRRSPPRSRVRRSPPSPSRARS